MTTATGCLPTCSQYIIIIINNKWSSTSVPSICPHSMHWHFIIYLHC